MIAFCKRIAANALFQDANRGNGQRLRVRRGNCSDGNRG